MNLSPVLIILSMLAVITNGLSHKLVVEEGQDVVLPCSPSTKENLEEKLFDWKKDENKDRKEVFFYMEGKYYGNGKSGQDKQFEGRVSHFNDELRNGNASIKIRKTKVADSGVYTCIFPKLEPPQKFHIELVVEPVFKDRSGENPAASPEPYTRTLHQTQDRALLQCEVRGASPEPKLEWRDSSGKLLHAEEAQRSITEGKYNPTIQINVTKSGEYHCVLKQEGIHHNISAKTFVFISEKVCEDSSVKVLNGWIGWMAFGLAVGAVVMAAVLTLCIPALRYRVIDFLSRLKPQRDQIQMNGVNENIAMIARGDGDP
uniref:Butyrophilin-like protein 2 n=1 Tax=Labrus bergylta TaxID=56723 RepID=A0A3Q3GGB3_9LABR|nr:selection and upkeep of intraepithelial T-cells protein 2-like isoform X2 [Labrus bergylta]XP_029138468.1 selection and upkeep of intraepithelial T-cells protein 2-like isoform X3 [Labrus bergylta]